MTNFQYFTLMAMLSLIVVHLAKAWWVALIWTIVMLYWFVLSVASLARKV